MKTAIKSNMRGYSPVPGYPTNMVNRFKRLLVCGSVDAGVVACQDKCSCGQQRGDKIAFRATNLYSVIFNKRVYFVVREELAVRELY